MSSGMQTLAAIVAGAFGVAMLAVIMSKNAQAPQVIQAAGQSLGYVIGQAVSPVTQSGGALSNSNYLGNSAGSYIPSLGSATVLA